MIGKLAAHRLVKSTMANLVPPIILASGSSARRQMLEDAGVSFKVDPANIDEDAIRQSVALSNPIADPAYVAGELARAKALDVSQRHPGALVIGSDQILNLGTEILTKSADVTAARATLSKLRGQTHALHSAVVLAFNGEIVWADVDTARLTMRAFSDEFLNHYLASEGAELFSAVGAFKLEGRGLQLFEVIEGDFFTILGMPLLSLLGALRRHRALRS